jgi:hypothetical protein
MAMRGRVLTGQNPSVAPFANFLVVELELRDARFELGCVGSAGHNEIYRSFQLGAQSPAFDGVLVCLCLADGEIQKHRYRLGRMGQEHGRSHHSRGVLTGNLRRTTDSVGPGVDVWPSGAAYGVETGDEQRARKGREVEGLCFRGGECSGAHLCGGVGGVEDVWPDLVLEEVGGRAGAGVADLGEASGGQRRGTRAAHGHARSARACSAARGWAVAALAAHPPARRM